jgi:hypothetical protein
MESNQTSKQQQQGHNNASGCGSSEAQEVADVATPSIRHLTPRQAAVIWRWLETGEMPVHHASSRSAKNPG